MVSGNYTGMISEGLSDLDLFRIQVAVVLLIIHFDVPLYGMVGIY